MSSWCRKRTGAVPLVRCTHVEITSTARAQVKVGVSSPMCCAPGDGGPLVLVLRRDGKVLAARRHGVDGPPGQPVEGPRIHPAAVTVRFQGQVLQFIVSSSYKEVWVFP